MAKKKTSKSAAKETSKKAKAKKEEVVDDEVEEEVEVEAEGDEEDDDIVEEDTTYVADMRSTALVRKVADSDAEICKRLSKIEEPEKRSELVLQHVKNLVAAEGNTSLALGEALYEIRANSYWRDVKDSEGNEFTKMETMWKEYFDIAPVTGYRHMKLYATLVVQLDLPVEEIEAIPITVWRAVMDQLTEENYDEIRKAIEDMTAKEAEAFAKSIRKIGLEEAVKHKDDEEELPEGDDTDDEEDGDDDFGDDAENVKTIKLVVPESTYNLFDSAITAAESLFPETDDDKGLRNRAFLKIITDWLTNDFQEEGQVDDASELAGLMVSAVQEAFPDAFEDEE